MYDSIGQGHLTLVAKIRMNVQTNVSNALSDRCMCETHQYTSGLFWVVTKPFKFSLHINRQSSALV